MYGESSATTSCRIHLSSGSRNQVSECGPRVIEIGSGRMGAFSDYICKSNEAVGKMEEIYIHTYIRNVHIRVYTCIYKIMDNREQG